MVGSYDSRGVDRRTLLAGGASFAAGGLFLSIGEANASSREPTRTLAIVAEQISATAVDVIPLQTNRRVRVELAPGAAVFAELAAGNGILAEGEERADGSIAAHRVIRGFFGERSDVTR